MKKINRQEVFNKYAGRCAYCGCKITMKNFQVDHIWPKAKLHQFIHPGYGNHEPADFFKIDNLNPACRECNYEKRSKDVEIFRKGLTDKLPILKNTFNFRIMHKYRQVGITEAPIKFYYECVIEKK